MSVRLPVPIARVLVAAWFGGMLTLGAALLAKHVGALPTPAHTEKLRASLGALRTKAAQGKWLSVHVLYAECRCSQRIVTHLLSGSRPAGFEEIVLWVGKAEPNPALDRHYRVKRVTSAELSQLGISAAPLLVVLSPNDEVRYMGGYSDRKQGPVLDDLRILAEAQRKNVLTEFPVFGCAVSERLKRELSILPGL